ncbi:MAG: hypothetical protein KJ645_09810, partial [Planctomycetes bacterium]|nr:hypothetical protein [Planctomycetota bacterium]
LTPALFVFGFQVFFPFRIAFLLGAVIASHPFFIFYSRYVRPYGICLALLCVIFVLLLKWQGSRKKSFLLGAALLSALSAWFSLVSLITTTCLFCAILLNVLFIKPDRSDKPASTKAHSVLWLLFAGLITAGLTLLLYGPALSDLSEQAFEGKMGRGSINSDALWRNAAVLAGYPGKAAFVALVGLSVIGALSLIRRKPNLAGMILVPALGQPLLVFLLNPALLDFTFVTARYLFFVLPLWLLSAILGVDTLGACLHPGFKKVLPYLGVGFCGTWLLMGPYHTIYNRENVYTHHNAYQTFFYGESAFWNDDSAQNDQTRFPAFYTKVQEEPLLLEGPAPVNFFDNMVAFYQHCHKRPVKLLATEDTFWGSSCFAFKNVIVLSNDTSFSFEKGAVAIVHKNGPKEIEEFLYRRPRPAASEVFSPQAVAILSAHLERLCGPPFYEDEYLRVYRVPPL